MATKKSAQGAKTKKATSTSKTKVEKVKVEKVVVENGKPKVEKKSRVKTVKAMTMNEMKTHLKYMDIDIKDKSQEELVALINMPEYDEKVQFEKKQGEPLVDGLFKGWFIDSKTGVLYAKLQYTTGDKRNLIKQYHKITRK